MMCELGVRRGALVLAGFLVAAWWAMGSAMAQVPPLQDTICPGAQQANAALAATLRTSPKATAQIAGQATAVYTAYQECGEGYLRKGDSGNFVYAIAQAADMYDVAVENYKSAGQVKNAQRAANDGIGSINTALKQPESPQLLKYKSTLQQQLQLLKAYMGQMYGKPPG